MSPVVDSRNKQTPTSRSGAKSSKLVAIVAGVAALLVLGRALGGYVPAFAAWVDGLGAWGPIAFIVSYALGTVAFVPGSVMTLLAGALFGVVWGSVYVFAAATLGAAAAFLVARYLARDSVESRLEGNTRFAAIDEAVGSEGRRIVFLLRLSPVFPFNLLNYALGLTRVGFVDYLLASVGMIPATILYVYYGKVAGDVASVVGGAAPERGAEHYAVLGLGLIATIAVTMIVTRIARRALAERTTLDADAAVS